MATRVSELRRLELEYGIAQLRQLGRRFCRLEHEPFGQEGQNDQNQRSDRRRDADQEMEREADCEIDRYPRQIE